MRIATVLRMLRSCFLLGSLAAASAATYASAEQFDAESIRRISGAVFEVVIEKPVRDSLSYAQPLPMHLIPYAVRTDKYYSIGTAFAIGPMQFVTAAHVLNLGLESQLPQACLRDRDGNIFQIDRVVKYSEQRDFAVFTLKGKMAQVYFQVNQIPAVNQKVFAVGNALGEGIVIRDGLYTSSTPEAENGAWKWLRFSAAASPGNSGGPLLDGAGNVIGVVLQKSPNENLNLALPISEVLNAKENLAVVHRLMQFSILNMPFGATAKSHQEIRLPKSPQELSRELVSGLELSGYDLADSVFKQHRAIIFPNGAGAENLLGTNHHLTFLFPYLIMQGQDGNWTVNRAPETKVADFPNNGRLKSGNIGNTLFFYLQKPDDMALETLYRDSKQFMDLVLKGFYLPRKFESEQVRVTSLGKPCEEYLFTDSYGRKWLVKSWLIEYSDEKVVTFSLPVPGGCVTMMRANQTGAVNVGDVADLKILTNFVMAPYHGTLKKWREFLAQRELLPQALSDLKLYFDYGKRFDYQSKHFSLSFTPELLRISEKSLVTLDLDFFRQGGRTVCDVSSLSYGEDLGEYTYFAITRASRPAKGASDKMQAEWEKLAGARYPYNRSAYSEDKFTAITGLVKAPQNPVPEVLYTALYGQNGKVEQAEMDRKFGQLLALITVGENERGSNISPGLMADPYHDQADYIRALWGQILEREPRTADDYVLRGHVYRHKGELEKAVADYGKAISLNANGAEQYYGLGLTYQLQGKVELALENYGKAIKADSKHSLSYINRGGLLQKRQRHDLALDDFSRALEADPTSAEAYNARGFSYSAKGELQKSLDDLDKALELKPGFANALSNRGTVHGRRKEYAQAIADFTKALELDPDNAEIYNNRGFTYKMKGDLASALADFDRATELDRNYTLAYVNRGNLYGMNNDRFRACADWKTACQQGVCGNYNLAKGKGGCQ